MSTATTMYRPTQSSPFSIHTQQSLKKKTMSITQTYYLAHKARAKLSHEAARADHDLRLLVGHANLLDGLMLELADAEREQESWFNQSVRGATKQQENKTGRVQWADKIVEEPEEDWEAEDAESSDSESDSDDDFDEEDVEMADVVSLRRVPSHKVATLTRTQHFEDDEDMEEDDLEEDYEGLELVRTSSHTGSLSSPPELDHDEDSSEDESMPPSPPSAMLPTFSNEKSAKKQSEESEQEHFYSEGFYLPPRNPARLVSAISVY